MLFLRLVRPQPFKTKHFSQFEIISVHYSFVESQFKTLLTDYRSEVSSL